MKFARFLYESEVCTGVVSNNGIKEIRGDMFGVWEYTGKVHSLEEVPLLAPDSWTFYFGYVQQTRYRI